MLYAHIAGWGRFLPGRVLTNEEISRHVETDHEWIYSRTGISERRVAEGETTATMANSRNCRKFLFWIPKSMVDAPVR